MAMTPEEKKKREESRKILELDFRTPVALEDISDTLMDIKIELHQLRIHLTKPGRM